MDSGSEGGQIKMDVKAIRGGLDNSKIAKSPKHIIDLSLADTDSILPDTNYTGRILSARLIIPNAALTDKVSKIDLCIEILGEDGQRIGALNDSGWTPNEKGIFVRHFTFGRILIQRYLDELEVEKPLPEFYHSDPVISNWDKFGCSLAGRICRLRPRRKACDPLHKADQTKA
jgi:hypothetical protein